MIYRGVLFVAATLFHTTFGQMGIYGVWLNGEFQGDGRDNYLRGPASKYKSPVHHPDFSYIACNTLGVREQPRWLEIKAGDTLAPEWYRTNRGDFESWQDQGPRTRRWVLVYIAPAVPEGPNAPNIWTKLFHQAYNTTDRRWADDYFQKNAERTTGHHYITIPDIPAGDYLIRTELIGLNQGWLENGAQHFPTCIQVRVKSGGSVVLPGGLSFPGAYIPLQPGLWYILGTDDANYPIPGGPVWKDSPGGGIFK